MNYYSRNRHHVMKTKYYLRRTILILLILFTNPIVIQKTQATENDSCVQNHNCAPTQSSQKADGRESIRQANRENALKDISAPSSQLFAWGAEHPAFYTGDRVSHVKALELLNEKIMEEINSRISEPKEVLIKDEFETTQAFQARELEYEKQYNEYVKIREARLASERLQIYADGFNQVFGAPILSGIEYDADHEEFNLSISANQSDYTVNAKVKAPLANAKETKEKLESLTPWVIFQVDGEMTIPKSVILQNKENTPSLIKRLDFTSKQTSQSLLIGENSYSKILQTKKQTEERAIQDKQREAEQNALLEEATELERIKSSGHSAGIIGHDITQNIKLRILYDNFGENPTCVISIQAYDPRMGLVHPNFNINVQIGRDNKIVWGRNVTLPGSELRLKFGNNSQQYKLDTQMQGGGVGTPLTPVIKDLFLSSLSIISNAGMLGDEPLVYNYDLTKFDKAYRFAIAICPY